MLRSLERSIKSENPHGSHVMGIIAAHVNNGKGIAGVTNNRVQIMPIQAFDVTGKKTYSDRLIRSIDYATKKAKDYNVRVINMSVGSGIKDPEWNREDLVLVDAIAEAHDKGIAFVSSAGNAEKGYTPPFYHTPGDFEQCISVINLENTNPEKPSAVKRYERSNFNTSKQMVKDISAPGTDIMSASDKGTSGYVEMTGTSMAAPMVAGIMALCSPLTTTSPSTKRRASCIRVRAHCIQRCSTSAIPSGAVSSATAPRTRCMP